MNAERKDKRESLKIKRELQEQQYHQNYKPTSLQQAVSVIGTCTDLCHEYECLDREYSNELSLPFEDPAYTSKDKVVHSENLPVKKYRRSAAGSNVDIYPEDIRTPATLVRVMQHLMSTAVLGRLDVEYLQVYNFIRDRIRAIRKDFKVQNYAGRESVYCLEQSVKFLVYSDYYLTSLCYGPGEYSAKQNRHQLVDTLYTLSQQGTSDEYQQLYQTVMMGGQVAVLFVNGLYGQLLESVKHMTLMEQCIMAAHITDLRQKVCRQLGGLTIECLELQGLLLFGTIDECDKFMLELGNLKEGQEYKLLKEQKLLPQDCQDFYKLKCIEDQLVGKSRMDIVAVPPYVPASGFNVQAQEYKPALSGSDVLSQSAASAAFGFGSNRSGFGSNIDSKSSTGFGTPAVSQFKFGSGATTGSFGSRDNKTAGFGSAGFGSQATPSTIIPVGSTDKPTPLFGIGSSSSFSFGSVPTTQTAAASSLSTQSVTPSFGSNVSQVAQPTQKPQPDLTPILKDVQQQIIEEFVKEVVTQEVELQYKMKQQRIEDNRKLQESLPNDWYDIFIQQVIQDTVYDYQKEHMERRRWLLSVVDDIEQLVVREVVADHVNFEFQLHRSNILYSKYLARKSVIKWRSYILKQRQIKLKAQRREELFQETLIQLQTVRSVIRKKIKL